MTFMTETCRKDSSCLLHTPINPLLNCGFRPEGVDSGQKVKNGKNVWNVRKRTETPVKPLRWEKRMLTVLNSFGQKVWFIPRGFSPKPQ